jgi:tetratricopeptide (TPR) repeat protein
MVLDPGLAEAHNNRGVLLRTLRRHAEAAESYRRAITIQPGHADAWYNRANALQEHNDFVDAIASYDQPLAIAPGHANALNNRAKAIFRPLGRAASRGLGQAKQPETTD